jgi:hypothetical protein
MAMKPLTKGEKARQAFINKRLKEIEKEKRKLEKEIEPLNVRSIMDGIGRVNQSTYKAMENVRLYTKNQQQN